MRRYGVSARAVSMALFFATVASCFAVPAVAAEGFGAKAGTAGKWMVYVDTDAMSDEKRCTALFEDREQVQLTPTSFAISYRGRGGVQAYQIRLDAAPARPLQIASDVEKRVGAALIEEPLYYEVAASKRVRVQAYTILNTVIDEDVDLSAMDDVKRLFAEAGCAA